MGHNCSLRPDVEFCDWGLVLGIRNSKTIQFWERVHKVPVASVSGPLCAVSLLKEMYRRLPASDAQNLFGWYSKNVCRGLTYDWFSKRLAKCLKTAGVSVSGHFTSHSLHRGGATALAMVGVPLYEIQKVGDWRSLSVLLYLASPLEFRISRECLNALLVVNL